MNKKQRVNWIYESIKKTNKPFKVLNEDSRGPSHIRVDGVGDIWPSTGTYSIKGKFKKGNPQEFIRLCGVESTEPRQQSKYDALQQRVIQLEEKYAYLDKMVDELLLGR